MKTLTIVCGCGDKSTFRAISTDMLIRMIDNANWQEHGWDKKRMAKMPKGVMPGKCEKCLAEADGSLQTA